MPVLRALMIHGSLDAILRYLWSVLEIVLERKGVAVFAMAVFARATVLMAVIVVEWAAEKHLQTAAQAQAAARQLLYP